jgi:hypothetical protein
MSQNMNPNDGHLIEYGVLEGQKGSIYTLASLSLE